MELSPKNSIFSLQLNPPISLQITSPSIIELSSISLPSIYYQVFIFVKFRNMISSFARSWIWNIKGDHLPISVVLISRCWLSDRQFPKVVESDAIKSATSEHHNFLFFSRIYKATVWTWFWLLVCFVHLYLSPYVGINRVDPYVWKVCWA